MGALLGGLVVMRLISVIALLRGLLAQIGAALTVVGARAGRADRATQAADPSPAGPPREDSAPSDGAGSGAGDAG